MVKIERLKQLLSYDKETGFFTRLVTTSSNAQEGERAGSRQKSGYIAIHIDGKKYLAHRLAWFYVTGEWPNKTIDHENKCRTDNRWKNLRDVSYGVNNANRDAYGVSNSKHVYPNGTGWMVKIGSKYIGTYQDKELAELVAVCSA